MLLIRFVIVACWLTNGLCCNGQEVTVSKRVVLMGSRFDMTVTAPDSSAAQERITEVIAEINRIENLISEWKPGTEIAGVNRNAGIRPVKVSTEVFELTKRALYYSRLTQGAFDISMASMDTIWKFDGSMTEMPAPEAVAKSVARSGYQKIVLDSTQSTIFLTQQGMRIGFGSIGKGYAADQGRALMKLRKVKGGIVNASGDLSAWGEQASGAPWKIGINHPFKPGRVLKVLQLREASVATSGSYEKYVELDGKRYAHIIDPTTGYPARGLISVTVLGPSAEFANALSTSVMVLGEKKGQELLRQFPMYRYFIVTDRGRIRQSGRDK